ncbi:883_t:CDS:2, partial [Rhizophagus irregularis]
MQYSSIPKPSSSFLVVRWMARSGGALSYIVNRRSTQQLCGLILLWKPDVKSAASDNSNLTTVLVVGESAASSNNQACEFEFMHCDLWFLRLRMLCDYRMLATGNQVGKIYFIFSCCSSDQSNGALSYIFNRQICGLCKMVRRSLSARDARILLWKSDVKSAASDNSIGLM